MNSINMAKIKHMQAWLGVLCEPSRPLGV